MAMEVDKIEAKKTDNTGWLNSCCPYRHFVHASLQNGHHLKQAQPVGTQTLQQLSSFTFNFMTTRTGASTEPIKCDFDRTPRN
jgi:hypothetical protein